MSLESANPVQLYGENPDGTLAPVTMDGSGNLNTGATFSGTVSIGTVSINDGGDATQGAKADAAATADTGTFSVVAILKRIVAKLTGIATNTTGLATEATLALAKADLDTIVTNTAGGGGGGGTVTQGPAGLDPWPISGTVAVSNPTDISALATETTLDAVATNTARPVATGTVANLWDAESVLAGGVSASVQLTRDVAPLIVGVSTAPTTIALGASLDDGDYFPLASVDHVTPNTDGVYPFSLSGVPYPVGTWLELFSSNAATLTASLRGL